MIAMKYHYNGKTIILNDTLMKQYKEMNGSKISDFDIRYLLKVEIKNTESLTGEEMSEIIERQIQSELSVLS